MQHTMDDKMRLMVQDGSLSEGAQKELAKTLGKALKDREMFEVKYKQNIVSAMSIYSDDDDVNGVHLFEDHFIHTMIATTKEYSYPFKYHDTYTSVFNNNQIAVHDGKPIMAPSETFSKGFTSYSRTNGGNVMLFQNTIISVKPVTLTNKRAREDEDGTF